MEKEASPFTTQLSDHREEGRGEILPITAGGMYYRAHKEKLNEESKERYRRRAKRTKLEAAKQEIQRLQEELRAALAALEAQLVEVQPRPRCGPKRGRCSPEPTC